MGGRQWTGPRGDPRSDHLGRRNGVDLGGDTSRCGSGSGSDYGRGQPPSSSGGGGKPGELGMCAAERRSEVVTVGGRIPGACQGCHSVDRAVAERRERQLRRERGRCWRGLGTGEGAGGGSGGHGPCATYGGTRRGGWRWQPRGRRAGIACRSWAARSRATSGRGGSGGRDQPAPCFVSAGRPIQGQEGCEGQEGKEGRQEEEEGQEEKQEEEKEEAFLFLKQQLKQQEPIQELVQHEQFGVEAPVAVEGERQGQGSPIFRHDSCGRFEMEETRGSHSLCHQAPRCPDRPFPSWSVRSAVKGNNEQVFPVAGGVGDGVGPSVYWVDGDPGHQRGVDAGGDFGLRESSGDRTGLGHSLPADSGHPSCEDEGRLLGKGGGDRADKHAEEPGQQRHAGPDKRLMRLWRQAWSRSASVGGALEGFGAFYSRVVVSLGKALGSTECFCSFSWHLMRIKQILYGGSGSFKHATPGGGMGRSPAHVFPLPPFSMGGAFVDERREGLEPSCPGFARGANLVVAALNFLHGGQGATGEQTFLSAAHRRVHARIASALEAMVVTDEPLLSGEGLDNYLKQSEHYSGGGVVLALGLRGGVPEKAADVPLHQHLKATFPEMAEQVAFPNALLLSSKRRPRHVKRGYTWLASSYPELVKRNVKAGLHCLKKSQQVAKHRGIKCLAGAFAVRKDDREDRVITDPSVNQLIDPEKLPRPRFAYIPKMRCVTVPSDGVLMVSKRDARHYFHRLQIGKRWHRWLCGPPASVVVGRGRSRQMFPASRAAPMGFGPSAGWAQGLTDVVARDAELPELRRLHPDEVSPESMPLWGSIVDDIWAVEHGSSQLDAGVGAAWMDAAESAWIARGVEPNAKKSVDASLGEEVQGYFVHPYGHWVGVSLEKRRHLFQATFHVLRQRRVPLAVVERLVGKYGFVHSARAPLRSIFEMTYTWLQQMRAEGQRMVQLSRSVWLELAVAALLLPFASFNLSSDWCHRIECTDASMSGIGRAWGVAPRHVVQTIARYADCGKVYTNLSLPWSFGLTSAHSCPLRRVRLPLERIKWHTAGAPWTPQHITLGEADAIGWAAEDRLRRPGDDGCRFVHPVDSAACAGSFTKGRSSSHMLNARCRRVCAVCVAGGHEVFYPWVPSADNPADEPSRRWEPGVDLNQVGVEHQPPPVSEVDLRGIPVWPEDSKFFIHLCSGPARAGDVCDWVEQLGALNELNIVSLRIDPLAKLGSTGIFLLGSEAGDLLNKQHGLFLLDLISSGKVIGGFASPPCSTVSRARHIPMQDGQSGPRPLRARTDVWYPLEYCTQKERHAVAIGSTLFLLCVGLLGEMALQGAWIGLEHPADPKHHYPSFFASNEVKSFVEMFALRYQEVHQCMYGAVSKKPTGLLLPRQGSRVDRKCDHRHSHAALKGLGVDGTFQTATAAKYPCLFGQALASCFLDRACSVAQRGYSRPYRPKGSVGDRLGQHKEPWFGLRDVGWAWAEPHHAASRLSCCKP